MGLDVGKLCVTGSESPKLPLQETNLMKTELKAKFLQHLLKKKQDDQGFTLIELLVVIIIIGVLSAIALPNFLNQTAKAKQSEAKQNIGVINRAQTAFRTENNQFATSFDALAIGSLAGNTSTTTSTNYSYGISGTTDSATITATARDTSLKAYSGASTKYTNASNQSAISSVICEATAPGTTDATPPIVTSTNSAPTCPPSGYKTLGN
jgi:type IV pilus assembly protein PilA